MQHAAHLHARGVLHGDLYAHNILWNGEHDCLLGDFGAASFFTPGDHAQSLALQRIEVRAYGCLLEELLHHCAASSRQHDSFAKLSSLKDSCLQPQVSARPLMGEVERELLAL
jgi:serine/threonine protein kinase